MFVLCANFEWQYGDNAELDDYLELARAGPALSDEQHIYNKLIFDAINEAITECIVDVSNNHPIPCLTFNSSFCLCMRVVVSWLDVILPDRNVCAASAHMPCGCQLA